MTVSDTDVSGVVAAEDGAVPQPAGRAARASFHELTVAAVEPLTDDSAAVTFAVPPELRDAYDFKAGQSLTLRRHIDGEEHRRSYSICAPAGASPRVGVREIPRSATPSRCRPRRAASRPTRGRVAGTCASRPGPASPRCCPSPQRCWPAPTTRG